MATPARPSYAGCRVLAEFIGPAVWLNLHIPLSLPCRPAHDLAQRGIAIGEGERVAGRIIASYETVRQARRSSARALQTRSATDCPQPAARGTATRLRR